MNYSDNTATSAITSAGCPTTMTVLISRNPMLTVSVPHFVDAASLTYQLPKQVHCADPKKLFVFYTTQSFRIAVIRDIATKSNFEQNESIPHPQPLLRVNLLKPTGYVMQQKV